MYLFLKESAHLVLAVLVFVALRGLSVVAVRGSPPVAGRGLPRAVASLVAERASRCPGFRRGGSRAQ